MYFPQLLLQCSHLLKPGFNFFLVICLSISQRQLGTGICDDSCCVTSLCCCQLSMSHYALYCWLLIFKLALCSLLTAHFSKEKNGVVAATSFIEIQREHLKRGQRLVFEGLYFHLKNFFPSALYFLVNT